MKKLFLATLALAALSANAFAAEQTIATLSKKCDEAKIKELVEGVAKVEKGAADGIYNITFDDTKTDNTKIAMKLMESKCIQ